MKCFYINESMLQDTDFSRNVLQRFLSYYRRHHGDLLCISAVGNYSLDVLPGNIPYVISPASFHIDTIQGVVMPNCVLLNDEKLSGVCSGMCLSYDSETKEINRIYFDIINDPVADITNRIMDEVQALLDDMQIKKHFYN